MHDRDTEKLHGRTTKWRWRLPAISVGKRVKLASLLESDVSKELDRSASHRDACDVVDRARPDGIAIGLAEAGFVQHVSGIRAELKLYIVLRPDVERLAE
jgi:hypothetical protein